MGNLSYLPLKLEGGFLLSFASHTIVLWFRMEDVEVTDAKESKKVSVWISMVLSLWGGGRGGGGGLLVFTREVERKEGYSILCFEERWKDKWSVADHDGILIEKEEVRWVCVLIVPSRIFIRRAGGRRKSRWSRKCWFKRVKGKDASRSRYVAWVQLVLRTVTLA